MPWDFKYRWRPRCTLLILRVQRGAFRWEQAGRAAVLGCQAEAAHGAVPKCPNPSYESLHGWAEERVLQAPADAQTMILKMLEQAGSKETHQLDGT